MKKYLLYAVTIVVYSVAIVLLQRSDAEIPNWLFWVLSIALVAVLAWIHSIGKGYSEKSEEKKSIVKEGEHNDNNGKTQRPNFTKEEMMALGSIALSSIIVNGRPDAQAEVTIISELEGFTLDDVKNMYRNLQSDLMKNAQLLKTRFAADPISSMKKKLYAAGFLATVIKSRTDGGSPELVEGWKKNVGYILGLPGMEMDNMVKLYNGFEHGNMNPDDAFVIFAWLSQVQYA